MNNAENYGSISAPVSATHVAIVDPTLCPFCQLRDDQCIMANRHIRAFHDSLPVSTGHTLIVPRRHVASIFDLHDDELQSIWNSVAQVRQQLQHEFKPDAFNIGVNDGTLLAVCRAGVGRGCLNRRWRFVMCAESEAKDSDDGKQFGNAFHLWTPRWTALTVHPHPCCFHSWRNLGPVQRAFISHSITRCGFTTFVD